MTRLLILTIFYSAFCQEGSGEEGSGIVETEIRSEIIPYTEHREWCRVCKSLSPEDCAKSEVFEQCWQTRRSYQKSICSMRIDYNNVGEDANILNYRVTTGCSTVTQCANEMRQNFASYQISKNNCYPPRLLNSNTRTSGVCTLCHRMTNHKSPNSDTGVFPEGDSSRIWTLDGGRNLVDVLNNALHYLKSNHPYNPFAYYLYSLQNDE